MWIDKYGQPVYTEGDLCQAYMVDQSRQLKNCHVDGAISFDSELELEDPPELIQYVESGLQVEEYDRINQASWHMPEEYKNLDIAKWVLDQCVDDNQRQRVGKELLMYLDRNLFPMLQYLKYLVDTMRKYNIVWGVGRGSSVSSYVLYLIGVHKIDSMYYDLDIDEFLR